MSRIWLSHVTHINEACHTYECIYSVPGVRMYKWIYFRNVFASCESFSDMFLLQLNLYIHMNPSMWIYKSKSQNRVFVCVCVTVLRVLSLTLSHILCVSLSLFLSLFLFHTHTQKHVIVFLAALTCVWRQICTAGGRWNGLAEVRRFWLDVHPLSSVSPSREIVVDRTVGV